MKNKSTRKYIIIVVVVLIVLGIFGIYNQHQKKFGGSTVESREMILEKANSKGRGWKIATELELDGYIISGAYSEDNMSAIAVFKPDKNGKYIFVNSTNRNNDEIITSNAIINDVWYDLVWFNGAQTEYAEITYTIDNNIWNPLRYDTTNMNIICNEAPGDDYIMNVSYYDSKGNKYE